MIICQQTPKHPAVIALLEEHLADMRAISPPDSVHALDIEALCLPEITFWCAWQIESKTYQTLMGCGALKSHGDAIAEVKSMRTAARFRGKGVAQAILDTMVSFAIEKNFQTIKLETGSTDHFSAAHRLYRKNGFAECAPFANYKPDPHSLFMSLNIRYKL